MKTACIPLCVFLLTCSSPPSGGESTPTTRRSKSLPESEPSAQAIAELIQTVEASETDRIFTEPQFRSSVLEQVAREAGVSIRTLHSQLSDAAPSYLALLRLNARALTG